MQGRNTEVAHQSNTALLATGPSFQLRGGTVMLSVRINVQLAIQVPLHSIAALIAFVFRR
jgi:hypothetical protein